MCWQFHPTQRLTRACGGAVQYDHEEMQEILGRSFAVDADVDEEELMGELDLIEDELALEPAAPAAADATPAFLAEPELPSAPQATVHANPLAQMRAGAQ